jgi:hypothetical protein
MREPLVEGKVAKIISVRELGINIGASQGVEEGMIFAILAETPLRVEDPDTAEVLGEIERYKVKVKATEVFDRFSICRTYETYETGGMFPSSLASFIALSGPATRHVRTLKIEDSELPPPLSEEESYVKVGDRVRQVPSQD